MRLFSFVIAIVIAHSAFGESDSPTKHVLFFSKASSWEQKIVHRDGNDLSYIEKTVQKLGWSNHIDFTFSKDGRDFTPENIAKFDAFCFFTSGDMTFEERNGRGDNYPLMTLEGKRAFLDAIKNGKGFVGLNTANYTFTTEFSPGETKDPANSWRYTRMIGSGYMGHNEIQPGHFSYLDREFPGMENVPLDYAPVDQWYAFNKLMPDIHVIMVLDASKMVGNLYGRPNYPIAWARMEGLGRVFYTTMGHASTIWEDPIFQKMLLGGIRWAARMTNANVTPDISTVTPHHNDIPQAASKFIASNPTAENPHFPGFKVWLDHPYSITNALKNVLVYTKSAGYEHPILYRDTAWPSFLEKELLELGQENNINFVFTKDGSVFTPEKMARYDAFLFYTSGNLMDDTRDSRGRGDNYPVMPAGAMQALLQAIQNGKGFVGIHSAVETFARDPGADQLSTNDPYSLMLGATGLRSDPIQNAHLIQTDKTFPGMGMLSDDLDLPEQESYLLKNFSSNLHVLLALDPSNQNEKLHSRSNYPVAWARMEGKGRVYYTILGHNEAIWKTPQFRRMILGAVRWTTGLENADVTPNLDKVTPDAIKLSTERSSIY